MKNRIATTCILLVVMITSIIAQKPKPEKITATFIVSIHCNSCKSKITNALQEEIGIQKLKVNMQDKTVAITFMSDKNSVSNLLAVFKKLGYTAIVQEVSCIGSKEGCLNAIHPESTMR
jgi:periplasmic mercuric ion binding protein